MDTVVILVAESYVKNDYGEQIAVKTEREAFATVRSVSREEWFKAAQNDLQASFVIVMPFVNYQNEKIIKIDGVEYAVYRHYRQDKSDMIELYCERKAGVV